MTKIADILEEDTLTLGQLIKHVVENGADLDSPVVMSVKGDALNIKSIHCDGYNVYLRSWVDK